MTATLYSLRVFDLVKTKLHAISGFTIEAGSISITIGGIVLFLRLGLSRSDCPDHPQRARGGRITKMTLPRGVANSVSTMSYYSLLMLGRSWR